MSPRSRFYADLVCGHIVDCSASTLEGEYVWCPWCKVDVVIRRVREG